jgi:hypothetical protein
MLEVFHEPLFTLAERREIGRDRRRGWPTLPHLQHLSLCTKTCDGIVWVYVVDKQESATAILFISERLTAI